RPASLCPPDMIPCFYNLDYQQPLGAFSQSSLNPGYRGVAIRLSGRIDVLSALHSQLLDATPGSVGSFWDAPLGASRTFTDPTGLTIKVLTHDSSKAKVRITFPGGGSGGPTCLDGSVPPAQPTPPGLCRDGHQDGTETAVDCGGGTCPPCLIGQTCVVH